MAQHCQGSETSSNQFSLLPQASCLHPCKPSISVYDRSIYPNSKLIDIFQIIGLVNLLFQFFGAFVTTLVVLFLLCFGLYWWEQKKIFGNVGLIKNGNSNSYCVCFWGSWVSKVTWRRYLQIQWNRKNKNSWSWTKILHHFGPPNTFYNLAMGYKWCRIFFHHQYHRPQIWLWKVHWNLKIWPQNVYKIWLQNI